MLMGMCRNPQADLYGRKLIGDKVRFGNGLAYIVCWLWDYGFAHGEQQAALPTFEFGWTFLLVAGLLNYLAMLDAFDIAAGRKS